MLEMVCTAFGPKFSDRVPPGIKPATQYITIKDHALNCLDMANMVSTNLMIGVIVFTNA